MIVIEHNIPTPSTQYESIKTMEIGDSFLVHNSIALSSARAWVKKWCPDMEMTARQNDSGYRVWRIK
tara:strand:+ start:482 stop:682 length:201 start_codon:yes stop_codon:yes gene_type:complete